MNWDIIEGNWTHFKGVVRETWGKLSNDQLDVIAGKREQLLGGLQEAYGILREQADGLQKASEVRQEDVDKRGETGPECKKALPSETGKRPGGPVAAA